MGGNGEPLATRGTFGEEEGDARPGPALVKLGLKAPHMHNVSTLQLHGWHISQTRRVADRTVRVLGLAEGPLRLLFHTLLGQTWKTRGLIAKA